MEVVWWGGFLRGARIIWIIYEGTGGGFRVTCSKKADLSVLYETKLK